MNCEKTAKVCIVLKKPNTIEVLSDLLHEQKTFSFFCNMYGKKIKWALTELTRFGMINKVRDETKTPIGYSITERGRWVLNSCLNFDREFVRMES